MKKEALNCCLKSSTRRKIEVAFSKLKLIRFQQLLANAQHMNCKGFNPLQPIVIIFNLL